MDLYQVFYEKYWFPFFEYIIKGRNTAKIYKNICNTENLSNRELLEIQTLALKQLMMHADQYSPFHHCRFKEAGLAPELIKSPGDLLSLPIMTKDHIRKNYDQIANKVKAPLWTKTTGGSTGEPLRFAYTKESYEWRVAMSKRGYAWAGALPGAKQAYIWGVQLGEVARLKKFKERMHHYVDRQLYFNCFDFDEKAMAICLAELNRFKPVTIIGYTNPLYNLALFIGDNSRIDFTLQGIICAAEKVHLHQREVMERVFGAKVFNTYGSREFMLIAGECEKHEGLHVSAENLIVEIVKDDGTPAKEGEIGRIVVTDLHNFGMPFIRYEIGDLGVATMKPCSCGRGLPLVADVVGRSLDVIKTPEGKAVPGEFFPHLIKDFGEIKQFQVVQKKLDLLIVKLVPFSTLTKDTKDRLALEIRKVVGSRVLIEFQVLDEIPLNATGKFRVTISEIN